MYKHKLMGKPFKPQCIHIEYKSKNSWDHSVFTLNSIYSIETRKSKNKGEKGNLPRFYSIKGSCGLRSMGEKGYPPG
ncbi:hypothetical protein OUZ56_033477 [Daphnia magna]|uniref:Uncharacterized protein n=1 Tax=Daphnia magna TaxID=35525 RepID=A0ABR0BAS0_9CRUS|nr:hypothetical protein OUZ56_033477 [Daphnia magna]